ncbi:MAG: hypothetical protein U9N13_08670 [Euryarchaeota archaeon]|nr:hypothetical protein [Euryarchaeota archaeon]
MDRTKLKNLLREENTSSLKALPHDFFSSVDEYIRELETEINRIQNLRSPEAKILEDELQSAINDVETIFIRRIRKITARATSNAFSNTSSKQDLDKLLSSEKKVYGSTLSAIQLARSELLEPILNPTASENKGCDTTPHRIDGDKEGAPAPTGAALPENITDNEDDSTQDLEGVAKSNINEEYFVVRILKDLPTFKAVDDRDYTLNEEDVVVLPAMNARGLVKRGAAHMINKK